MDIVQDIRRSLELDKETPSVLSECVERSLELLTDQLYNTDTRFLLEFVQNAEDNQYNPDLKPTLRIGVTDASITLRCNEVGFSENNVRAICKIGASTKKNIAGFIGEKGIGFKSVFKIADVVHVASGPYTFKFDRKERLGMIAPIWDASRSSESGWTTFHLELSNRRKISNSTLEELRSAIKPSLLLFLKQLRSIELDIKVKGSGPATSINIERTNLDTGLIQLTRTQNGVMYSKDVYFISRHVVRTSDVPKDMRRGTDWTEIVLAFPIGKDRKPLLALQDVHAFLPVRKFGFKFVINADFLTSSSREDILNDSPWNKNIRDAIADAFVAAIQVFQDQTDLRNIWIRYLPKGIVDTFFSPVERNLLKILQTMQIVKDCNGVLRRPSEVLRVSSPYRYKGGALIEEKFTPFWYLSDDYDQTMDLPVLERLGVCEMTSKHFLSAIARIPEAYLSDRQNGWHEAICNELARVYRWNRRQFENHLLGARILPLDDGSWSEVRNACDFVFESDVSGIPSHIDFRRIHRRIHPSSCPRQYELFKLLGVRQADLVFIAERILDSGGWLSVEGHVSNASYFFDNRFSQPKLPSPAGRLRVVDESGTTATGENLYLDLPSDNGMLRRLLPSSARFLNASYIERFRNHQSDGWLRWLHDKLGLNTAPRIINGHLSPEFKAMMTASNLQHALEALKYFWPRLPVRSGAAWPKELGELRVKTEDGSRCALNSMYLGRGIISKYRGISFVPVAQPESRDWDFLRLIGVTIEADVAFFVKLLIQYEGQSMDDEETVKQIYKQLDARFDEDASRIINAFRSHALVYVPEVVKGKNWTHLADVYWTGPKAMTTKVALHDIYPKLEDFFQWRLGLTNAPPEILIDELKTLAEEWAHKPITQNVHDSVSNLLVDIASFTKRGQIRASLVTALLQCAIFPTYHSETGICLQKLVDIYVPDNSGYYAGLFRGKIPLLELAGTESRLPMLKDLLRLVPDDLRLLDKCVHHEMEPHGRRSLHDELTAGYCKKYGFFERLALDNPKYSDRNDECLSKLQETSIYLVDRISSKLTIPGVSPVSTDTDLVQLQEEESSIIIYINKSALNSYKQDAQIGTIHLGICKRFADMLGCNIDLLLLCVTLPDEIFESILKEKGIGSATLQHSTSEGWVQAVNIQVSSYTTSYSHARTSFRSVAPHDGPRRMAVSSGCSQDRFCMRSLETEINKIMQTIPKFSTPSRLVVHYGGLTPSRLVRLLASARPQASVSSSLTPLPDITSIPCEAMQTMGSQHPNIGQTHAHGLAYTASRTSVESLTVVSSQFIGDLSGPSFYQEVNGFLGERFVYEFLSAIIGPTFGPQNWTSELRQHYPGLEPFEEESLADFTYEDCEGILTEHLFADDPDGREQWNKVRPTYHIEVKSTSGGSREPFYMSKRQLQIALAMLDHNDENIGDKHVYVLIRVWNVRVPGQRPMPFLWIRSDASRTNR